MKIKLFVILIGLVFLAGINPDFTSGQPIRVEVALLDKNMAPSDTFSFCEPINMKISLKNTGTTDIFTSATFIHQDFRPNLQITGPDKRNIAYKNQKKQPEPPPPETLLHEGKVVQVEHIVKLPRNWIKTIVFDARDSYFTRTGKYKDVIYKRGLYSVIASILMRAYRPDIVIKRNGKLYAPIRSAGAIKHKFTSKAVNFKIQ